MSIPPYPGPNDQPTNTGSQQIPPYPGPAAQQPGYPGYPGYPGPTAQSGYQPNGLREKPKTPGSVTGAFVLYVVGAVAYVVSVVVLVNSSAFQDIVTAVTNDPSVNTAGVSVESLVSLTKGIMIGIFVLLAALFVTFALVMRAGYNWARIVLTVLSALSIASSFSGSTRGEVTVGGRTYTAESGFNWLGWVGVGLSVVAIVLMFLGTSNRYFTACRIVRKGR